MVLSFSLVYTTLTILRLSKLDTILTILRSTKLDTILAILRLSNTTLTIKLFSKLDTIFAMNMVNIHKKLSTSILLYDSVLHCMTYIIQYMTKLISFRASEEDCERIDLIKKKIFTNSDTGALRYALGIATQNKVIEEPEQEEQEEEQQEQHERNPIVESLRSQFSGAFISTDDLEEQERLRLIREKKQSDMAKVTDDDGFFVEKDITKMTEVQRSFINKTTSELIANLQNVELPQDAIIKARYIQIHNAHPELPHEEIERISELERDADGNIMP